MTTASRPSLTFRRGGFSIGAVSASNSAIVTGCGVNTGVGCAAAGVVGRSGKYGAPTSFAIPETLGNDGAPGKISGRVVRHERTCR